MLLSENSSLLTGRIIEWLDRRYTDDAIVLNGCSQDKYKIKMSVVPKG